MSNAINDLKVVLVVDDDLTNRLVLSSLLKTSGYLSIEAENGEEAVSAVTEHHIDIILLDVMMPIMDGYEAARIIKKTQTRFIPIIFLTAMTDKNALAKCIKSGGDDFLTKPFNHVVLNSKIDSMLRIAELYKNIEEQSREIKEQNLLIEQEMQLTKKLFNKTIANDLRGDNAGLHYSMSPMSMFNGDLILSELNQTNGLDVLIGDFTGHGLSAAIGALPVSDVFRSMTQKGFAFANMLVEANTKLIELLPTHMFMATALISLDRSNNVLSIINAGLPDIYLYRQGEIVHTFKSKNIPLGISHLLPSQFEIEMQTLEYGDQIIASTDGIMEANNSNNEMFGLDRLLKIFKENSNPEKLFDTILSECSRFCEGAAQTDDITLLEVCHLEKVEYSTNRRLLNEHKEASNWSLEFSLDIKSLRQLDILPYLMQAVDQLQPLESGRTKVHTVLTEMFANALDHGVLKLDSSMKDSPQGYMDFYLEKQKRLETFEDGNIQISLRHELNDNGGGRLTLHLMDSGEGYDFKNVDTNKNQYSGRGIQLVSSLCTEMKILGKGNSVMAYYDWTVDKS
ncbi:Serine phosphatase RsbU, regulator of sigma subunit [hydrothermal vent metagenome]|uniref:Serine phosphatase RsbU, regulator of sigma subunit n=1 Tax=hydrothermal vent metagenome TaxID=652676 RepID=A0A3B0WMR3_9ZZZZ